MGLIVPSLALGLLAACSTNQVKDSSNAIAKLLYGTNNEIPAA